VSRVRSRSRRFLAVFLAAVLGLTVIDAVLIMTLVSPVRFETIAEGTNGCYRKESPAFVLIT
jgi:hypothetical protein